MNPTRHTPSDKLAHWPGWGLGPLSILLVLSFTGFLSVCANSQDDVVATLVNRYEQLGEKKAKQRREVLTLLGRTKSETAFNYLRECLKREKILSMKLHAVDAISLTTHPSALEFLQETIDSPGGSYLIRRRAILRLNRFDFDWRDHLARVAKRHPNVTTRSDALTRIATEKDAASLATMLKLFRFGDLAFRRNVIRVAGSHFPVDDIYRPMLSANLSPQSDPLLRQNALRILSQKKDRRFFRHVRSLTAKEQNAAYIAAWISWCVPFDSLEAIKAACSLLGRETPTTISLSFVDACAGMKSPEVVDWLRKNGSARGPVVKHGAVANIAKHGSTDADRKFLAKAARSGDAAMAGLAIAGLSRFQGKAGLKDIKQLLSHRNPVRSALALDALWKHQEGNKFAVEACVTAATRSSSPEMRVIAMELLKAKHAKDKRSVFEANLGHKSWKVRTVAYDALTWVRDKKSIELLLGRLSDERGRPLADLADALTDLTGFDWGEKEDRWRTWWNRTADKFVLPKKPTKKKKRSKFASYAHYYGLTVRSNRVVFIIDASGSMSSKLKGVSKIEKAKKNLIEVIQKFDTHVKFNIILFRTGFTAYRPVLVRATGREIDRAVKWIKAITASGGTNIFDSLEAALSMDEVDTIYLLSDGAPSAGRVTRAGDIERLIGIENRLLRVAIHTISITQGTGINGFMQRLSERNFGESVAR